MSYKRDTPVRVFQHSGVTQPKFLLGGYPHDRSRNLKLSSLDKLKISRSSITINGGSGLVEVTRLLNGRNLPSS